MSCGDRKIIEHNFFPDIERDFFLTSPSSRTTEAIRAIAPSTRKLKILIG